MDNLFENKFIQKLQLFGQKLAANPFMSALTASMMSTMGPIMVGAVFTIICAVCSDVFHLFAHEDTIYQILYMPYNFTNLLGLWVTTIFGFNYAKNSGLKSPLLTAINVTIVFMLTASTYDSASNIAAGNFGAAGLFVGFIVVFITVRIEKWVTDKNIRIPMPEVVPPSLTNALNSIIPLGLAVLVCYGANVIVNLVSGGALGVASLINQIFMIPVKYLLSVPGMVVIAILAGLMWAFGIHGTLIVYSVMMAPMYMKTFENIALYQAGVPLTFENAFDPTFLFGFVAICGGTGNTLPLCIMGLRSKSEQIKAVSKLGLVPGWFGINEPVTFGMPIMYNPILVIPYILTMVVNVILGYIGYRIGLIKFGFIMISALLPMGLARFLTTLDFKQFFIDYLFLIPDYLIWYPFFKVYEKQLVEEEQAMAAQG